MLEADLDFNKLKPCSHCKKPVPENATMCLYCGETINSGSSQKPWVVWTAAILLLMAIFSFFIFR